MLERAPEPKFVQLTADLRAYYALPAGGSPPRTMILCHYGFGLNDFMLAECRRLAAAGYAVLAPDVFRGDTFDYDTIPQCVAKIQTLSDAGLRDDIARSMLFLDERGAVGEAPRGIIGFCFGGRLAVLTAIEHGARIAAAVSFYGTGIAPERKRYFDSILDRLPDLQSPVLLLYGSKDESIPPDEHSRITETLSRHHKDFTLSVYGGAEHSFASDDGGTHYDKRIAEDAWSATLAFLARTVG